MFFLKLFLQGKDISKYNHLQIYLHGGYGSDDHGGHGNTNIQESQILIDQQRNIIHYFADNFLILVMLLKDAIDSCFFYSNDLVTVAVGFD